LVIAAAAPLARAGSDYSDKGFSLRLPPAFIRFREATTAGGHTAANRYSSAVNPAAADWTEVPSDNGVVIAPYYTAVCFRSGVKLHVTSQALNWDTRKYGTIQPSISQIRSNNETSLLGMTFDYSVDTFQVQWAKRTGEWAFGMNFNVSHVETIQKMTGVTSISTAESYRFRFGGLWEFAEDWLAGAAFEYGFAPFRAKTTVLTRDGPVTTPSSGTPHQFVFRPGVSYQYAEYSSVYLDYQYGAFLHLGGELHSHWLTLGVDHRLLEWLFLRGAVAADARGNFGWSAGVGVHMAEWLSVDFGYQCSMYPELRPTFGRAHTLQLVVSARF
jgi:hypothetical protein